MIELSASILSADQGDLRGEIEGIKTGIDSLHFDIMDGHFVPEISFGASLVESLRNYFSLPFYVHLMVEKPEKHIHRFALAGADAIYIHLESTPHLHRALEKIKEKELKAGVALNPATPLSSLEELWDMIDLLLIMTVNPGYGGQELLPFTLNKVAKAKRIISEGGYATKIAVDGGINNITAKQARDAGASILVVGSYIFQSEDPLKALIELRESLKG
ncbi:ribulose-phosphate 3-epimerase [bacterium]|nr:ribulose-phosphate 3-epimerase [bacterium]